MTNDTLRLRTVFRSLWLRGVCARLMTAVDDHRLRAVIEQKLQRLGPAARRYPRATASRLWADSADNQGQLRVIKG